jgi:hypothetical protein
MDMKMVYFSFFHFVTILNTYFSTMQVTLSLLVEVERTQIPVLKSLYI